MTLEELVRIISEVTKIDEKEISAETLFNEDLGLDSLEMIKIVAALEEKMDFEMSFEKASSLTSVGDLYEFLTK